LEGPWKGTQPILEPKSWDDEIARRIYSGRRAKFYNMSAFLYNNIYLGLLGVLYVTAEQIPCDGPIDSQFVYSRDGIYWERADRERTPAIVRGRTDAFDRGMILGVAKKPIIDGDEVHWYYTGCEHTYGEVDMEKHVKRLGRVTWRRDRFVNLTAEGSGMVQNKGLVLPEETNGLEVNADALGGQIGAELCDSDGRASAGFSRKDCVALSSDELRWAVKWKSAELTTVEGEVKIWFILNRSKLYSFTFRPTRA
jgi:hypothetical protein